MPSPADRRLDDVLSVGGVNRLLQGLEVAQFFRRLLGASLPSRLLLAFGVQLFLFCLSNFSLTWKIRPPR